MNFLADLNVKKCTAWKRRLIWHRIGIDFWRPFDVVWTFSSLGKTSVLTLMTLHLSSVFKCKVYQIQHLVPVNTYRVHRKWLSIESVNVGRHCSQLSQNRKNPNFGEHEQTLHFNFFGILEVPKHAVRKYFIGGPFRKLGSYLN